MAMAIFRQIFHVNLMLLSQWVINKKTEAHENKWVRQQPLGAIP
jgi:hypothetical protein